MSHGFLHCNLNNGLTSQALCKALLKLFPNPERVQDELENFFSSGVKFFHEKNSETNLKFLLNEDEINFSKITWEQINSISELKKIFHKEIFLIDDVKNFFQTKKISPTNSEIACKILDEIFCDEKFFKKISKEIIVKNIFELSLMLSLLQALDPKFISASKVFVGEPNGGHELNQSNVLNNVLCHIPSVEVAHKKIVLDVLALAFIKTICSSYGPRGDSTVLQVARANIGSESEVELELLWCETFLPDTICELGPTNNARKNNFYALNGLIPSSQDMQRLMLELSLSGARNWSYHLVHGEEQRTFFDLKVFCHEENKNELIEALLIKGAAKDVSVRMSECHKLNRRQVAVPLGHGNKKTCYRFFEYTYLDKTVRVEPLIEDLNSYVQKTNYSVDVARSDLLMAWKKWRGRIFAEDQ